MKSLFSQNRFARKVLALFLLAVILPVMALSTHALTNLNQTIDEQLNEEVERTARAAGQGVVERLLFAERRLIELSRGEFPPADDIFEQISVLPPGQLPRPMKLVVKPGPSAEQAKVQIVHQGPDIALIGVLRPEVLGAIGTLIPSQASFCVTESSSRLVVFCSDRTLSASVAAGDLDLSERVGVTRVQLGEEEHVAAHWSLFLKPTFGVEQWKILATRNRDEALSEFGFLTAFPLIVALALAVAAMLSLTLLRRGLQPMQSLMAATQRLSEQDFSTPVQIESDDEFEQLGTAFNAMTGRLRHQFGRLEMLADLDRRVLESHAAKDIGDWMLTNLSKLVDHQAAALLLIRPHGGVTIKTATVGSSDLQVQRYSHNPLPHALLTAAHVHHLADPARELPELAETFDDYADIGALSIAGISHGDELLGVLAVGFASQQQSAAASHSLGELRDRLAVAFSSIQREEALFNQAHFDQLTGLPNRFLFLDRLEHELGRAKHHNARLSVLFIDLDRFKNVNDSLGHSIGDDLLHAFGQRLQACLRESDTAARLGGDEFTVLQPDLKNDDDATTLAGRIASVLGEPFEVGGQKIYVTASIGIALFPDDGMTAELLLRNADAAMYLAKERGRSTVAYYSKQLSERAQHRLDTESRLRRAVRDKAFELHYQAQYDMDDRLCGAEALIRMRDGGETPLSPSEFIPLAEQIGLIPTIGCWALEEACRFQARLNHAGLDLPKLAVNVSPIQLRDPAFAELVKSIASRNDADLSRLAIEITETALADHIGAVQRTLNDLAALGCQIVLDDFGTGHSSLRYLQQFPIQVLKLDRSFVTNAVSIRQDRDLATAIVLLAHHLDKPVIAEGVETEGQLDLVKSLGCQMIQGYLRAKPVDADTFAAMLSRPKLAAVRA